MLFINILIARKIHPRTTETLMSALRKNFLKDAVSMTFNFFFFYLLFKSCIDNNAISNYSYIKIDGIQYYTILNLDYS